MKKILLIAAALFFFIAPLTYHPDNKAVLFWASQDNGKVWNIWEYGEKNLKPDQQFNYPPLHFYLDKLQYAISKPLGGEGYVEWLGSSNKEDFFNPLLARYMMATKFPLILFALVAGYLIYLLAKHFGLSEKRSRVAAAIWFFNPITLYSIPIMGQNDVMAIVFFLAGWLLLSRKPVIAAVIFGLASSIKTYPLIWLAFLLPATKNISRKQKVGVFLLSVFVYVMTLVPFLHNSTFLSAGSNSEINNRFLIPQISIGFDQAIYVIPLLLSVVFFAINSSPAAILLTANLILLGFSHFHPQWYTWTIPFFALWIVSCKNRDNILAAILLSIVTIGSWMAVVFLFADKWLTVGILSVANPSLGNLPVLREFLLARGFDVNLYNNLAQTALAAVGLISLIALLSRKFSDEKAEFSLKFIDRLGKWWSEVPRVLRIFLSLLLAGGLMIIWIGLTQLIPAPSSTKPITKNNYLEINNKLIGSIETKQNNFYRFDLAFSNPKQRNVGKYLVSLYENGNSLHKQIISGMNIGEDTVIRFDLADVQENSNNRTYEVVVEAIEGTKSASSSRNEAGYISASVIEPNTQNSLEVQEFFKPSQNLNNIFEKTVAVVQNIFSQVPWYYVLIVGLICLGV